MKDKPLIHIISNEVSLNDVVNVALGAGAGAICGYDINEVEEITSISDVLLLNTGMPSSYKINSMLLAAATANKKNIPIVLDPVGAGASKLRNDFLRNLINSKKISLIKGNKSEIAYLCGISFISNGVEKAEVNININDIKRLSASTGAVILMTGEVNTLVLNNETFLINGGSNYLTKITGCGCMLGSFIAAVTGKYGLSLDTVSLTLSLFNNAAKESENEMQKKGLKGTASYKLCFMDKLSSIDWRIYENK